MTDTTKNEYSLFKANQMGISTVLNSMIWKNDALVMPTVINQTETSPPGSPSSGDRYIIPTNTPIAVGGVEAGSTSYTIAAVVAGAGGTFRIDGGDYESVFVADQVFVITGTVKNNGTWTTASSLYSAGDNWTTITVVGTQTVVADVAGGSITVGNTFEITDSDETSTFTSGFIFSIVGSINNSKANEWVVAGSGSVTVNGDADTIIPVTATVGATADGNIEYATGDWNGHIDDIAHYYNSTWYFYTPTDGWVEWDIAEDAYYYWDASDWSLVPGSGSFAEDTRSNLLAQGSPVEGRLYYVSDDHCFGYYDGSNWREIQTVLM